MYKLKNTYVDKMIQCKLTSREIDFLLHIALYQDETGRVESVYYRDICSQIDISIQKFYDIINSLVEKELIEFEKRNYKDLVVKLIDNDFSNVVYSKGINGYINIAQNDFKNSKFKNLKAGAKLLYLFSQRFISGKHMFVSKFYKEFCELFGISKKSLQLYVRELKQNKLLFISKKRNKAYNYEMTMKRSSVLYFKGPTSSENSLYKENLISHLKINYKRYMPAQDEDKTLYSIAELTSAKRAKRHKNFFNLVIEAVEISIQLQIREKKEKPILNAPLINKCLTEVLESKLMTQFNIKLA